ncbi:MAG: NAD-dependent epimerase/dehydratase family protein [Pseudomonadota bacterium]
MADQRPLAALTGGTGFLGRYVIAALQKAGWRVRLLVRRDPTHPQLPGLEAEIVMGDLLSHPDILRRFSADTDAVIHLAGAIKARDRAGFFRVNERGSGALGAALAEAAPQEARLIQVSSLAAREPHLSDYAASKRAGEVAFAEAAGRDVTVLRPGAVHGPWDTETLVLFQLAQRPFMPVPALPDGRLSFVYAADVARAIVAFVLAPKAFPGPFELSDNRPDGYGWRELSEAAARAMGRTPRLVSVPRAVWPVAGTVVESWARLTGSTPMMSRGKVREMLHPDWSVSAARLPPATLWAPDISLETGFARTVDWARGAGLLSESRTVR